MTLVLLFGKTNYQVDLVDWRVPISQTMVGALALDGSIAVVFSWLLFTAHRSRLTLKYLSETEFRSLAALADVVIMGKSELLTPDEVAENIDRYLAGFAGHGKWIVKVALTGLEFVPLVYFRKPLSHMSSADRLNFLQDRFYRDVDRRLVPAFWRTIMQAMIRLGKQLCYIGYYKDPRTFASVGYVPFSQRPRAGKRLTSIHVPTERRRLRVLTAADLKGETVSTDLLIVGSGAAASVLAYRLAARGHEVVLVEKGKHVDRSEFGEDEMEMMSKLYADGALQLSRDFEFQVLQGSCVGGTTVVNNAVCFDLPPAVLDRWNARNICDAGLDPDRLRKSFADVRGLIGVERQDRNVFLSPGAKYVSEGVRRLGLDQPPNQYEVVEANIHDCLGCGYCNIGCQFGRKLSMLDTVLPEAQTKFGDDKLACSFRPTVWRMGLDVIRGNWRQRAFAVGQILLASQCR